MSKLYLNDSKIYLRFDLIIRYRITCASVCVCCVYLGLLITQLYFHSLKLPEDLNICICVGGGCGC